MHNEKLSALMDGESFDSELFNDLSRDVKLQQSWQRYHLIRDVMRGDAGEDLHLDIADRVAAAIAGKSGVQHAADDGPGVPGQPGRPVGQQRRGG